MSGNGSSGRSWVGRSVSRVEDARHLTGRGMFVDDIERPRMLYAAFARSPFGAARVEKISVEDAIGVSGVERVITRSDLEDVPGLRPGAPRREFLGAARPLRRGQELRGGRYGGIRRGEGHYPL